ncbi:glycosyltransferase family 4 protein [Saccharibacillus sp. JS10]|uniref:glycosyltransferase family 4 protein n=1 Tax=Saccharibacillus sp. JS10 TaxID=2950552 RepID=UPI00210B3B50|nr:glycosyltransferase family 4 protein [Saccharibacillus sp. JS10]MCQ4087916.1 glycosyltransferase family 4 protein [Saccharibacillus sp. JS10]
MKILLYAGSLNTVSRSGVGEAIRHQREALERLNIPYTMDEKDDYDLVHLNTIFPDSLRMARKAKRKGKKVVYHAHSTMEDFRNSFIGSNLAAPLFKKWILRCYRTADLIITPTDYAKGLIEAYGAIPPIVSLSNGVDSEFFAPDPEAGQRFRQKHGLSRQTKVVLSVGHYIERKGILDFVELARRMPDHEFYWFGFTPLYLVPPKIREAVETKLPNLHFPGYVTRGELRDAYCGSDLFLFATHEETEGIVLLEALAAEIPVLVRDLPIYAEWLEDGGTVHKAQSLETFEQKIRGITERSLPNLTANGRQLALGLDLDAIGERLVAFYAETLQQESVQQSIQLPTREA